MKGIPSGMQEEIIELHKEGYKPKEIADIHNLCKAAVSRVVIKHNKNGYQDKSHINVIDIDSFPKGSGKTADNMIYAIMRGELTLAEGNTKELAQQLDVSIATVYHMLTPAYLKRAQGTQKMYPVFLYDEEEIDNE